MNNANFGWAKRACVLSLLWAAAAIASPAQTLTTLHSFDKTDGNLPAATLIQATGGDFYGTTVLGGSGACNNGCGTIFKITADGTLTTIHSFDGADGAQPIGGLVQASDGDFYGTTAIGGGCVGQFCGTVFKITSDGTLSTLHKFCLQSGCPDGNYPLAPLLQATNGNFYGTTHNGGGNNGVGTIFEITPKGALTTLYRFPSSYGAGPTGGLIQATDGNLYGTSFGGGTYNSGTVFKITPSGTLTTIYSFCKGAVCPDGSEPGNVLLQAADGNFYGTTHVDGTGGGGTVYKVTPTGTFTTLYSFLCTQNACPEGGYPEAGLIQATDGNFYGTTQISDGAGTVFKITPNGMLTTVWNFDLYDGDLPYAGLLQGTNGDFYGATENGGAYNNCVYGCGTIFSLSVGLGPFVETQPASGKVGAAVKILGTNLTGATSVSFNGIQATFTVRLRSLIPLPYPPAPPPARSRW